MAGSLGVSQLVCLLNNGSMGETETTANLLGPFWRMHVPRVENGGTLLRSPTPGPTLYVRGQVLDREGKPIAGADVDVWHSSPVGLYEQQDPEQAEMNLRGMFTTDSDGRFWFRTVKPPAIRCRSKGLSAISCARRDGSIIARRTCIS